MNYKKTCIFAAFSLVLASLVGCNKKEDSKNYYNISFLNDDQSLLKKVEVEEGQLPVYEGTPEKTATAEFTYTFSGWDKEIVAATEDTSYVATYTSTKRSYTVKFVDVDGTELQKETLEYGATPVYKGEDPTKATDAAATYTFNGWDKDIVVVTGEATYVATYSSQVRQYLVKFLDENGTELQSGLVNYGDTPAYNGTPAKASTAQYEYEFAGWDPVITSVTGEATYTATYTESVRKYTVHFETNGGTEIPDQSVEYGSTAIKPDDPEKAPTAEEIFFFDGWETSEHASYDFDTPVTGDVSLAAIWDAVSATEHGHRCEFVHYEEKEATYVKPGYSEFWYCELHDSYVTTEPTEYSSIEDAEGSFEGTIESTDPRYLPKLEGGNVYLKIDASNYLDGTALVYSEDAFAHITEVSFKMRVEGAKAEGRNAWLGISINEDHSLYEQRYIYDYYQLDNEWRTYSIANSNDYAGFVNFVHAVGEFEDNSYIYIDDISVEYEYGDEKIFEDFEGDEFLFEFNEEHVELVGEKKLNTFAHLKVGKDSMFGEYALLYSRIYFNNISTVTFKVRLTSTSPSWWGVGLTDNITSAPRIYTGMESWGGGVDNSWHACSIAADGAWHTKTLEFDGQSGYLVFGNESGSFAIGSTMDLDNICVTFGDDTVLTENFEGEVIFKMYTDLHDNPNSRSVYLASEEPARCYMRLYVGQNNSSYSILYTAESLPQITNVTMKIRLTGGKKEGQGGWWGVGIADDHKIYTNMHNGSAAFDGEWHEVSINCAGETGCLNFIQASGEFLEETTFDIDDFVITYNNGESTLVENFDDILVMSTNETYAKLMQY